MDIISIINRLKNFTNEQYILGSSALQETVEPNNPKTPLPKIPPLLTG